MHFYNFTDYDALFDLIDYTRVRVSVFFKIIRTYEIHDIQRLYEVCKKKFPKKDKVITSNIDSHIGRALDLLLYPKSEMILPVARFYGSRLKEYMEKKKGWKVNFVKNLLIGEPVLNHIDLLVINPRIDDVKNVLKEFYLFGKLIDEQKDCISFESKRGHIYNIYLATHENMGNKLFFLSFKNSVINEIKRHFPSYIITPESIVLNGKKYIFSDEKEIFEFLNLQFIPYELRWDREVVRKAIKKDIPNLVKVEDIIGDFHTHTFFSDGEGAIEDIIHGAKSLKYKYVGITEHSESQKTGNGISPLDWYLEREYIKKLNHDFSPFRVLAGLEVDILGDGGFDFPYEVLSKMDFVILALHHPEYGKLDPNERIAYAMRSGIGSILAHPKDRYWGKEHLFKLDIDYLYENAVQYNVALEISSIPDRIGFSAEEIKKGRKRGVKFAINSDAHAPGYLRNIDIGIIRARRGWLTRDDVINTYTLEKLKAMELLKNKIDVR